MPERTTKFDAVAMVRAARDRVAAATEGMSVEEGFEWLDSQELHDPALKLPWGRFARQSEAVDRSVADQ